MCSVLWSGCSGWHENQLSGKLRTLTKVSLWKYCSCWDNWHNWILYYWTSLVVCCKLWIYHLFLLVCTLQGMKHPAYWPALSCVLDFGTQWPCWPSVHHQEVQDPNPSLGLLYPLQHHVSSSHGLTWDQQLTTNRSTWDSAEMGCLAYRHGHHPNYRWKHPGHSCCIAWKKAAERHQLFSNVTCCCGSLGGTPGDAHCPCYHSLW